MNPFANLTFDDRYVVQNISCSICHEIYVNPIITQCSHTFCTKCFDVMEINLENMTERRILRKETFKNCMICHKEIRSHFKDRRLSKIIDDYFERQDQEMKGKRMAFVMNRKDYEQQRRGRIFTDRLQIRRRTAKIMNHMNESEHKVSNSSCDEQSEKEK